MSPSAASARPLRVAIVVGEESGDQLGGRLMMALKARAPAIEFVGLGGHAMAAEGLASIFPLTDVTLMGFVQVIGGLRRVLARIRQAADAVIAAAPDVLVIVDSPDFTHRVARRVRAMRPELPIVDYVSPSVWAWRPGRAGAMRAYVDHVLALLPFEPDAHRRLGGPACSFVGHPLAERIAELRPGPAEARRREEAPPVLLLLPGSRDSEVRRLLPPFAGAVERLRARAGPLEVVIPTLPHLADELAVAIVGWPSKPRVLVDPAQKRAAFRVARAALAASGTVTLELALAGVPTVAAYRVAKVDELILRRLVKVSSVILANLVMGENVVPELLQQDCTPERLADALAPLLSDTPERRRQLAAFARLDAAMEIGTAFPSERAAEIVLAHAQGEAQGRPVGGVR